MGAHQSHDGKPPRICTLMTKAGHEILLIPLTEDYFPDTDFPGFQGLLRARGDEKTRYFYNRGVADTCSTLSGEANPEQVFDFCIARQSRQISELGPDCASPIGCAIGLVMKPGEMHDATFVGKHVRICGRVACRNVNRGAPWEAGIFMKHQYTDGIFKFVAVLAAAAYIHQAAGAQVVPHYRDVQFTTLFQNLSMLRAIRTLRGVLAGQGLPEDKLEQVMTFSTRDNRYFMTMAAPDVKVIAERLAALAKYKEKFSNDHILAFALPTALPVQETVSVPRSLQFVASLEQLAEHIRIEPTAEDSLIVCVHSTINLVRDTLDEAVFLLSGISKLCDLYKTSTTLIFSTANLDDLPFKMYFKCRPVRQETG